MSPSSPISEHGSGCGWGTAQPSSRKVAPNCWSRAIHSRAPPGGPSPEQKLCCRSKLVMHVVLMVVFPSLGVRCPKQTPRELLPWVPVPLQPYERFWWDIVLELELECVPRRVVQILEDLTLQPVQHAIFFHFVGRLPRFGTPGLGVNEAVVGQQKVALTTAVLGGGGLLLHLHEFP